DVGLLIPNGIIKVEPPSTLPAEIRQRLEVKKASMTLNVDGYDIDSPGLSLSSADSNHPIPGTSAAIWAPPNSPTFNQILNDLLGLESEGEGLLPAAAGDIVTPIVNPVSGEIPHDMVFQTTEYHDIRSE
ncbi:unnamed protein product, partial [Allacma fusca]